MKKLTKLFLIFLTTLLLVFTEAIIFAQEAGPDIETEDASPSGELIMVPQGATEVSPEIIEAVNLDEDIQPADLGVGDPSILPDSPFYFLKNWGRTIRSFLAFNPTVKAELESEFANEKLMELKKMVTIKKNPEAIKKATENYQKTIEKVKTITEKIEEKAEESPQVEKFLDKFVKHQLLHQRLLQRLENQVPDEALEKIKTVRERHLEKFAEVMTSLENRKEKIEEVLEKNMEEIKGSKYKNFKNLEVLLELEEKVPEEAKEAIKKAQENSLKRLQGDLEKMSPQDQEKFKAYIESIGGVKEKHLEILESLKSELKDKPEIKERIINIREGVMETVRKQVRNLNCPEIQKPAFGFCREGRIVVKKDDQGCITSFECVIPAEIELPSAEKPQACITLWDPVCGKNGKTYSNTCFSKLAGVEVAYKGKCTEKQCQTDADCPQPRCGPAGTISARCIGMGAKCVEGRCQIQSVELPAEEVPETNIQAEETSQ